MSKDIEFLLESLRGTEYLDAQEQVKKENIEEAKEILYKYSEESKNKIIEYIKTKLKKKLFEEIPQENWKNINMDENIIINYGGEMINNVFIKEHNNEYFFYDKEQNLVSLKKAVQVWILKDM